MNIILNILYATSGIFTFSQYKFCNKVINSTVLFSLMLESNIYSLKVVALCNVEIPKNVFHYR